MTIFKTAENTMAYAKVGILGFAGSGKTRTGWEIAKGLHKAIKSKKPIAFMDTETGSDFILPLAKEAGIELLVSKSRAFKDLTTGIKEAEKVCDILQIDSVSHYWLDLVESYKKKKNTNRLAFQDWGILKPMWGEFSTWYVTSSIHVIVCGRAGFEYDYFQDEDSGKMELYKTGTKMKAEGEFGFEPSLLIEMERIKNPEATDEYRKAKTKEAKEKAAKQMRDARQWLRRAWVLKDRADVLDGQYFDNPTFKDFEPHWQSINLGGEHHPVEQGDSQGLFDSNGQPEWKRNRTEGTIILEKIENEMIRNGFAGQGKDEKKKKIMMLECLFNTSSWTEITEKIIKKIPDLDDALWFLRSVAGDDDTLGRIWDGQITYQNRQKLGAPSEEKQLDIPI